LFLQNTIKRPPRSSEWGRMDGTIHSRKDRGQDHTYHVDQFFPTDCLHISAPTSCKNPISEFLSLFVKILYLEPLALLNANHQNAQLDVVKSRHNNRTPLSPEQPQKAVNNHISLQQNVRFSEV
ncbi:hypothetical protein KCU59_g144, partial [Aureobasidium melanogenum]